MSLATRCTACGTAFRVVQDQLKISEGWVRCGQCDAVFNALEGLFDLGRDLDPGWEDARPRGGAAAPKTSLPTARIGRRPVANDARSRRRSPRTKARPRTSASCSPIRSMRTSSARGVAQRARRSRPDRSSRAIASSSRTRASIPTSSPTTPPSPRTRRSAAVDRRGLPAPGERDATGFLRRAERQAMWRSAGMRGALGTASALAAPRPRAAGRESRARCPGRAVPVAARALLAWCGLVGCTLRDAATHRRGRGRQHGADPRRRPGRIRARREPEESQRPGARDALDRPHAHRWSGPPGRAARASRRGTSTPPSAAAGRRGGAAGHAQRRDASVVGYTVEIFYP